MSGSPADRTATAPVDSSTDPERPLLDLFAAEFAADPYPLYATLRAHRSVHYASATGRQLAVLSRYADVQRALRDPRFSRLSYANRLRANLGDGPLSRSFAHWMLFRDPPDHTRLRGVVTRAFTPRAVERLRSRIREIVTGLLDIVAHESEFDLIADFAAPLPVFVICELLGVPAQDRPLFATWSTALAASLDHLTSPEADALQSGDVAAAGLTDYFREVVVRRSAPLADDLLSGLLSATQDGDRLSEDELLATCVLLFFAGHETTVNLIGNGMLALLRSPDQLTHLQAGRSGTDQAVEELLRFDSPVQRSSRVLLADVELGPGVSICAGETVVLLLGAANRDPTQFMRPERLDLARPNANQHLSFGAGIHYCIGAPLARLEAQIAISELLRRLPRMRLLDQRFAWQPTYGLRGLQALRVASGLARPSHVPRN